MTPWRLETYETLASTSDLCTSRAKTGEPEALAVMAIIQTAGRGSRGRVWQAPEGNLNLSILLRPRLSAADAGIFSLLAGVAVAEALTDFLPTGAVPMLKWPNDVLLKDAKLAGILIDASPLGGRLDWLVIGIGVNLRRAPTIPGRLTTTLADHGAHLTAASACTAVLGQLAYWLAILETSGSAAICDAWLRHAHPIGTPISLQAAHRAAEGLFAGISPSGELLLAHDNIIERINTGEVLLGVMRG